MGTDKHLSLTYNLAGFVKHFAHVKLHVVKGRDGIDVGIDAIGYGLALRGIRATGDRDTDGHS